MTAVNQTGEITEEYVVQIATEMGIESINSAMVRLIQESVKNTVSIAAQMGMPVTGVRVLVETKLAEPRLTEMIERIREKYYSLYPEGEFYRGSTRQLLYYLTGRDKGTRSKIGHTIQSIENKLDLIISKFGTPFPVGTPAWTVRGCNYPAEQCTLVGVTKDGHVSVSGVAGTTFSPNAVFLSLEEANSYIEKLKADLK